MLVEGHHGPGAPGHCAAAAMGPLREGGGQHSCGGAERHHAAGILQRQDIFRPDGRIRPVFAFKDHGAAFQGPSRVPLAQRDVEGNYRPRRHTTVSDEWRCR